MAFNMSGTMSRTFKMLIVSVALYAVWLVPGSAFQLFGGSDSQSTGSSASIHQPMDTVPRLPSGTTLDLGEDGTIDSSGNETMNIWIPGIGVVGKMPKLDFGLEMLYGAQKTQEDAPHAARELEEFDSDFAIKGTIKRKF